MCLQFWSKTGGPWAQGQPEQVFISKNKPKNDKTTNAHENYDYFLGHFFFDPNIFITASNFLLKYQLWTFEIKLLDLKLTGTCAQ